MNATPGSRRRPIPRRLSRLARHVVSPKVFDFWASRLHPTWSWERPLARVVARQVESRDAVTLWLKPNRHWQGFSAGQHINLTAEIDGTRITRSYSLSDASRRDGRIAITVKAIEGGRMSRHLCETTQVGDVLGLGQAFGEMRLPPSVTGAWLFLAAGSGITPLISLTRDLATRGMPVPVTLIYWARTREELCFVEELRAFASKYPNFDVRFVLTREMAASDDEAEGRIDEALLNQLTPDAAQRQIYACGPGGFVERARTMLASRAPSFFAEAFTPPPTVVEDRGTVQVTLAMSGRTLAVSRGESLLKALNDAGFKAASGCRMGICNTCACGKRAGSTRHLHSGDVEHEPVSALRLCVNSANTDLVLDL